jgi:hypothetical protein
MTITVRKYIEKPHAVALTTTWGLGNSGVSARMASSQVPFYRTAPFRGRVHPCPLIPRFRRSPRPSPLALMTKSVANGE